MSIALIQVPWDSGHRGRRMGGGPLELVDQGLAGVLSDRGHETRRASVEADLDLPAENAVAFQLAGTLAREVRAARKGGSFPLVLAGNCNSCLGTVPGLGADRVGVIWFDAHGDFNTPETSASGFLDGMALATLTGRCWTAAVETIPGFAPVPEERVVLVGVRHLDPEEERALAESRISMVAPELMGERGVEATLVPALERLEDRVDGVYVHVDLDVLDPEVARANAFAAPGGLSLEELLACVEEIGARFDLVGAALAAYDPAADPERRALGAAFEVAVGLAASAAPA